VGLLDLKIGNIQPSSKPNLFVAPYVVTGGLGTPEITTTYPGSNFVSFDAESIASGLLRCDEQRRSGTRHRLHDPLHW
jgi:hypothetical protein